MKIHAVAEYSYKFMLVTMVICMMSIGITCIIYGDWLIKCIGAIFIAIAVMFLLANQTPKSCK